MAMNVRTRPDPPRARSGLRLLALAAVVGAAVVALPAGVAHAQTSGPVLLVGEDFLLAAGEVADGDVTIIAGDLEIEQGAEVTGNVLVAVGDAVIEGHVGGNVTVSGDLILGDDAEVGGDVFALGDYEPGQATVHGDTVTPSGSARLGAASRRPAATRAEMLTGWFTNTFLLTLVATVLATLVAAMVPQHVARVWRATATRPAPALAAGCLTWLLLVPVFVLLAITIIGILAVPLAFALLWLLGWTALASAVGARLLRSPAGPVAAFAGAAIVGLLGNALFFSGAGGLGAALWLAVMLAPLGGAVLTVFGTRWWPSPPPDLDSVLAGHAPPGPPDVPAGWPPVEPWTPPPAPEAPPPAPEAPPPAPEPPAPAPEPPPPARAELTSVPGITPVYALLLRQAGIDDLAALADASPARVAEVASAPGVIPVNEAAAAAWIEAARALVAGA
jgi:predicted flap endonuclease-1-like 5' DNA nuclease